ncbi:MAG: hypothetical protein IJ120_12680 [Solobacterium sp.]|nr:hypothetical protein [Solobacterium sp.]
MSAVQYDTMNTEVQMTMVVKLHQLQRENLSTLTYRNLEDYLNESLWKAELPTSLHAAVNDILSVTANDIVKFLSRQAMTRGGRETLEDFSDLIGGE